MDVLYNDLENYDDVDAVNRLKAENSELKHKLEDCYRGMQRLQQEFDNLEVEFKRLQTNYSSLLKISRAEIQRKTEMITHLNIEKDLLVINALKNGPAHQVKQIVRNVREETEVRRKKKRKNKAGGQKEREEVIRRKSSRAASPANSSTTTDNSNKIRGNEGVPDNKAIKTDTQENEPQNDEVFPDTRPSAPVADKLVSALSCKTVTQENEQKTGEFPNNRPSTPVVDKRVSALARHQLAKLSSDEEFEDMYSALKPKATREPDRNRKRGRDDSHDGKVLYNSLHSRPYPDPFRERLNRKAGRFSDNERNINREKQHNESDRSMNRGKHYNNDRRHNSNDLHYQRFSPERQRRSAKELGDDRYRNRRLESPPREKQRFGSPQREKHQFKKIRERRKSYHGRDREYQEPDPLGYKYPETTIHGAYGEPQNKKPRIQPNSVHQEEKMPNEKQYHKESHLDSGNPTSKSPDFSHSEESSNEPVTAQSDVKSTASLVYDYEDPRRNSKSYVKCSEGNGDTLQCAHAHKIYLQPVDKSLWHLQEVQVPKALRSKPAEISEEHVDKMNLDKALSIASLESGELDSDTTETALDDNYDQDVLNINERGKLETKPHKENSPVYNDMAKDIRNKSGSLRNDSKTTRHKLPKPEKEKIRKTDEPSTLTSKNSCKADTNTKKHCDNTQMPNILQKLIHSMNEEIPDRDTTGKLSNSREENEPNKVAESMISSKTGMPSSKSKADYKPEMKNTDKSEKETENDRGKESKLIAETRMSNKTENTVLRAKEELENKIMSELKTTYKLCKETNKEKEPTGMAEPNISDNNKKASLKTRDNIEPKNMSELKNIDNPEKVSKKNMEKESTRTEESRILAKNENECLPSREVEHKHMSELKTKDKQETENNVTIFHQFEHRVYSRHIVEGDLELSDESNDEAQLKIEKKKAPSKRKSHRETSKEKRVDSDTRKTRSQKDKQKDIKSVNKFSELFGDSSSLITPEDLNLATRTAHGLPADCCPPATEEAQDSLIGTEPLLKTQTTKVYHKSDFKDSLDKPTITEDKYKCKDSKDNRTRTKNKQNKDLENEIVPNDKQKDSSEQVITEVRKEIVNRTESHSGSEENLVLDYRIKKIQKAKISNDTQQNGAKLNETPKDLKSNKIPKTKGEKKLSHIENKEEIDMNKIHNTPEPTSNNTLTINDNKENTSKNGNSEGNISNKMSRVFENTLVSDKTSFSDVSEINKETPQFNDSTKETSSVIQDVPNLAPVREERGLVKTVVISTGVQPPNSNSLKYATPFNALASSTPAKDLSAINISSEMEPQIKNSGHVSVTIARDDSLSQPEADEPDMRITCYRRRRKVLKR